jgi:hypothetical protein
VECGFGATFAATRTFAYCSREPPPHLINFLIDDPPPLFNDSNDWNIIILNLAIGAVAGLAGALLLSTVMSWCFDRPHYSVFEGTTHAVANTMMAEKAEKVVEAKADAAKVDGKAAVSERGDGAAAPAGGHIGVSFFVWVLGAFASGVFEYYNVNGNLNYFSGDRASHDAPGIG